MDYARMSELSGLILTILTSQADERSHGRGASTERDLGLANAYLHLACQSLLVLSCFSSLDLLLVRSLSALSTSKYQRPGMTRPASRRCFRNRTDIPWRHSHGSSDLRYYVYCQAPSPFARSSSKTSEWLGSLARLFAPREGRCQGRTAPQVYMILVQPRPDVARWPSSLWCSETRASRTPTSFQSGR